MNVQFDALIQVSVTRSRLVATLGKPTKQTAFELDISVNKLHIFFTYLLALIVNQCSPLKAV